MKEFAFICKQNIPNEYIDYFDYYNNNNGLNFVFTDIKEYELNNKMYKGILVLNNNKLIYNDNLILSIFRLDLSKNVLYTLSSKETDIVNDEILISNSFVFSTICNYKRTMTNLFGECFNHKIKIENINIQ